VLSQWTLSPLGESAVTPVSGSAGCPGAQVAVGRRPVGGAGPVFDAGDDPPVGAGTCSVAQMRELIANRLDSRKDIELGNTREVSRARIAHGAH